MSGTFLDTEGTPKGEPQDTANRGRKHYLRPIEISKKELGEVSEWSKEHAWKVCVSQGTEGSNPSLTAITNPQTPTKAPKNENVLLITDPKLNQCLAKP